MCILKTSYRPLNCFPLGLSSWYLHLIHKVSLIFSFSDIVLFWWFINHHDMCPYIWCSLLYGAEDPSIAGMVLDSAFSNLYDLMMELVEVYKIRVPKFTVWLSCAECFGSLFSLKLHFISAIYVYFYDIIIGTYMHFSIMNAHSRLVCVTIKLYCLAMWDVLQLCKFFVV